MDCTHLWGPHTHWFWVMPLLFMLLMIVFAAVMARRARSWRCGFGRTWPGWAGWDQRGQRWAARGCAETPRRILDRRYARGEITREEYEQMRREVESEPRHPGSEGVS